MRAIVSGAIWPSDPLLPGNPPPSAAGEKGGLALQWAWEWEWEWEWEWQWEWTASGTRTAL